MTTLLTGAVLAFAMQAGGLAPLEFADVATASDGTAYAIDKTAIKQITRSGFPVRSASVRVTYSASANAEFEQAVRHYYVRCGESTAGLASSINTERGTKRLSMDRTRIADIVYHPFDALPPAEKATMATICALDL
ncbi:MAG: hypothetical protein GW855_13340 [Erythrobacter sp.]|nr:hypothetical protein [Erythrobacter sp.]NCQ63938.1 hypothetical protein [Alphaproteobacteria bacterium]